MRTVIKRNFPNEDIPSTYEASEKICGVRLDRRRNYAIINGEVCSFHSWTRPCSGCSCDGEYPCTCCVERGAGCDWFGHTGKQREGFWLTIKTPEFKE